MIDFDRFEIISSFSFFFFLVCVSVCACATYVDYYFRSDYFNITRRKLVGEARATSALFLPQCLPPSVLTLALTRLKRRQNDWMNRRCFVFMATET